MRKNNRYILILRKELVKYFDKLGKKMKTKFEVSPALSTPNTIAFNIRSVGNPTITWVLPIQQNKKKLKKKPKVYHPTTFKEGA